MYKEVLRAIVGIEVFPVLSLLIFLAVFVGMLIWVARLDRRHLAVHANLPLDDDGTAAAAAAARRGALGGTQL